VAMSSQGMWVSRRITQMRILSGSSQDSGLPRFVRVGGFLDLMGRGWAILRRIGDVIGDGMAEVVIAASKVGMSVEVASVLKLTAEIGETSGRGMNTEGNVN